MAERAGKKWAFRGLIALLVLLSVFILLRSGGNEVIAGLPDDPAVSQEPGTAEFSILTYNVQARPWFDDAREKLPKISPLLQGYDIVVVQECFQQHRLLWEGTGQPNRAFFGSLAHPFKLASTGLSVLSHLPLRGVEMTHYRRNGEFQNRVASKGILLMRLNAGGWPLDVYNTHMEAGGRPEAQPARMDQARQMVEFVTKHSPPEHAVIVCGDFNMMPLRPDKTPAQYTPGHFDSIEDLQGRTAAFQVMLEGLQLRDASDELFGPVRDDIERFLFRAPKGGEMTALELAQNTTDFKRADGSALSDGWPFIARFRIAPLTARAE